MSGYPNNNPQHPYPNNNPQHPYSYPPEYTLPPNQRYPRMPTIPYGEHLGAISYPGVPAPSAPSAPLAPMPGFAVAPGVAPTPVYPGYGQLVQWVPSNCDSAEVLTQRAVVAGYEGYDGSPLWLIRSQHEGDLIPGKLAVKHKAAYVPWGGKENKVTQFEVCCAPAEKIRWVEGRNGSFPPNAIPGGRTSTGETLYIGRAKERGSLTPGKIHPSHKMCYISFGGDEIPHPNYEVLCFV